MLAHSQPTDVADFLIAPQQALAPMHAPVMTAKIAHIFDTRTKLTTLRFFVLCTCHVPVLSGNEHPNEYHVSVPLHDSQTRM